jgi:hypothetical protein
LKNDDFQAFYMLELKPEILPLFFKHNFTWHIIPSWQFFYQYLKYLALAFLLLNCSHEKYTLILVLEHIRRNKVSRGSEKEKKSFKVRENIYLFEDELLYQKQEKWKNMFFWGGDSWQIRWWVCEVCVTLDLFWITDLSKKRGWNTLMIACTHEGHYSWSKALFLRSGRTVH